MELHLFQAIQVYRVPALQHAYIFDGIEEILKKNKNYMYLYQLLSKR